MTSPNGGAPTSGNGPDATVGTVHQPRPLGGKGGAIKAPRPTQKNLGYSQPKTRKSGK